MMYPIKAVAEGLDITRSSGVVSIIYSVWHGLAVRPGVPIYDNSKILANNPGNPQWGPEQQYHFWSEPVLGYYRLDEKIVRIHMDELQAAHVDCLILEAANVDRENINNRELYCRAS